MVRTATIGDLPRILEVYAAARQYMRNHGNTVQWGGKDRPESKLENDIRLGQLYVLEDDGICAVFAFIVGDDPTYAVIEGGTWRSDTEYGTLHRLGSDGTHRGVMAEVFRWMSTQIDHIRVDTHESNLTMQRAVERCGFQRRGIIYVPDGTPRLAYDWVKE
ncbi:MAG: N-acetyltransferase [Clostridiales bacterium]|nr:N-acetyltransferase [Candidatus Cacconaster stercorequi]